MTKTWIRITLRTWFVLSIAVCLLAGDYSAAAACGFFWGMTEY
jgi:uncharacterized membrane protein